MRVSSCCLRGARLLTRTGCLFPGKPTPVLGQRLSGSVLRQRLSGSVLGQRLSGSVLGQRPVFLVRRGYSSETPVRPKFDILSTPKSALEYILGCVLGLGGGYLVWGTDVKKQAETIQQLKRDIDLEQLRKLDPVNASAPNVCTIVLTGGPCGGKSTAMAVLTKHLKAKGFEVYSVPEVPTLVLTAGSPPFSSMDEKQLMAFEKQLFTIQVQLEDSFKKIASAMGKPAVILLDRAVLDIHAYLPHPLWMQLLDEVGVTEKQIRERYTAVVHLVTAANGAEKYYTTTNNAARTEGLDQAKELDEKVKLAWLAHTRTFVADNSTDFRHKMERVCSFLDGVVGNPNDKTPA